MKIRQRKRLIYKLFSQFLSEVAKVRADNRIVLSMRESLMILDLIENPPQRNAKFIEAQARYGMWKNDALDELMTEYETRKVNGSDTKFGWP